MPFGKPQSSNARAQRQPIASGQAKYVPGVKNVVANVLSRSKLAEFRALWPQADKVMLDFRKELGKLGVPLPRLNCRFPGSHDKMYVLICLVGVRFILQLARCGRVIYPRGCVAFPV
ncbi:hypothetical protein NDU88_006722 [Pleurodeles waltl]|uniref:Uncharacterized protein n=1 Tax=Pleurodeles waltl TaxID=8319 RepID=A0AAV7PP99_PLEWA|nr:hypothetical protein NDU88_006722 [Pleurodeles waltl]